ncbi:MAG: bifunctional phosphopantothenoylcysteine decarboxylase/phosphopantothenate--cysteine ligase CoaBC [Candidatus Caldatribacteriota bacterium]|nr:bifunctional phosphopantothenoylcysteine decarboxylase/phosphopantothenate--cysteine ligase CoaBC [Candidatus Caldatribacteriota bacterium]
MLKGKKIILGVTGSIAAYKAAEIVNLLKKRKAEVFVIMTESATKFIQPLTFSTLSGNSVIDNLFSTDDKIVIKHISLAEWADLILIAPATANIIGKISNGIADDMLTATVMATKVKVIFAPAMNKNMISNPLYQHNVEKLTALGYEFIDSEYGRLASGETGKGRLANIEDIADTAEHALTFINDYQGKTVLVTASCTREPIDKVRFISNYSSGKMGFALAKIARARGARVILITGPTFLSVPKGISTILIESAEEMKKEVFKHFSEADIIISAAAVADFRPRDVFAGKIKKEKSEKPIIELERTPDILYELGKKKGDKILVGFAAETENLTANALKKLKEKRLDLIVANDISAKEAGFGSDNNRARLINSKGSVRELSLMPKIDMAGKILDEILKIK